jgi:protein-tyrosine phosphatase
LNEEKLENGDKEGLENIQESVNSQLNKTTSLFSKAEIIQKAFKKIYSHTLNSNRILIHCSLGVSRSSTIAIMFLMKKFQLNYDEVRGLY